jgi:hypothetical protein
MNTPLKEIASTGPSSVKFLKGEGLCFAQDIAALSDKEFEILIQFQTHQLRHALRIVKLNAEQIVPMLVPEAVAVRIEDIRYFDKENDEVPCGSMPSSTFVKEEVVLASAKIGEGNTKFK